MRRPRKVIVACMRNEALFLVEWIAHHLAVGFNHIVVYTNDCDDGTDDLLDLMSTAFPVHHVRNPGPYKQGTIQKQALADAFRRREVRKAAWVLHIDADEYVNVRFGQRRIDDLIARYPEVDGIALMWRHFGSAGRGTWNGGSILEGFQHCEARLPVPEAGEMAAFKTMFRPSRFREMGIHTPKRPPRHHVPRIVNAAGIELPLDCVVRRRGSGYPVTSAHCTWDNACLHHHHVKSDDLHRAKHARGDANGRNNGKREIGSPHYLASDRNEGTDASIQQLRPRARRIEAGLRAIPGLAETEARALDQFRVLWQKPHLMAAE